MRRTLMAKLLILSLVLVFCVAQAPTIVLAHEEGSSSGSETESEEKNSNEKTRAEKAIEANKRQAELREQAKQKQAELKEKSEDKKEARQEKIETKLSESKKRVCEQRKKNIANIMKRNAERAEKQIELFSSIAERVQEFYVKKGKTLSNYDELVAAVNSAKTQTETDLATLKALSGTFDCDSDDPKGDVSGFKAAAEVVAEDLKSFRTAVKNLIVGVKSVQSTTVPEGDES